jgi:hypothetical protein
VPELFIFPDLFDMVQRRLLTADFVNNILPPEKGELWIADSKVRGFGLRLFASKGGGKSFCVRTTDETGMVLRKSFSKDWRYKLALRDAQRESKLGDLLEEARDWARREIEDLKHLDMTYHERRDRSRSIARLVGKMTLERAAQSLLRGMVVYGRHQAYVDRLDKLFSQYVPDELKKRSLANVPPQKLAKA